MSRLTLLIAAALICSCGASPHASTPPAAGDPGEPTEHPDGGGASARPPDAGPLLALQDDAEIVAVELPGRLDCAATTSGKITVRNRGAATWSRAAGYALGAVGDSDPFVASGRIALSEGVSVRPGESHLFELPLRASRTLSAVSDWQMVHEGVRWFGPLASQQITADCGARRAGKVRLSGHSLEDDGGKFSALGVSLFWAAWGYRNDRPRLEAALALLARNGFDYIRVLGVVGDPRAPDSWDGREIDKDWPDYAAVIAGLTDLAYDRYGLRVQWTLIGDGQVSVPSSAERYALADSFLKMSLGREQKIILFEVANEYFKNGFGGPTGLQELRALSAYLNARTDILVAPSAPADSEGCGEMEAMHAGAVADVATIHFSRDVGGAEGPWRPVRAPWSLADCKVPPGSSNEPIGPGSSVAQENDPLRLAASMLAASVSGVPMYVFHTRAGVRGDLELAAMPGLDAFAKAKTLAPGDLASWSRQDCQAADAPFRCYAIDAGGNRVADRMWPELQAPQGGAVRVYSGVNGKQFFVLPFGILNRLVLEARRDMDLEVHDPVSGKVVDRVGLNAGQRFELEGASAFVLKGAFR